MDQGATRGIGGAGDPPEYRGSRLRVRRERHALPDGRQVSLDAVRTPAVAYIVPILEDGRVALIRQYRPIVGAEIWELPAGTIEAGESPEACARRELVEEAGYEAGRLEPLGEALADPGLTDERIFLFVARDLRPAPRGLDADEHIEVVPVPIGEAYRMADAGDILDAGTLVALYRFRSRAGDRAGRRAGVSPGTAAGPSRPGARSRASRRRATSRRPGSSG